MVSCCKGKRMFINVILTLWDWQKQVRKRSAQNWKCGEEVLLVVAWI